MSAEPAGWISAGDDGRDIVCIITHDDQGGAQEAILRLARRLRLRGHRAEVWFLYRRAGRYGAEPETRVLLEAERIGLAEYREITRRLTAALRTRRPDAVISFLPLANVLGQVVARHLGVPCRIASQRNPGWTYTRLIRWADRLAGSLGTYTANVANSEAVRASFAGYPGSYRRRLSVVYNGIDWVPSVLNAAAARSRFGLPQHGVLVLALGRLCRQKNQELLLRAAAPVARLGIVLAGDGEDRPALEQLADDLGMAARVHFLGSVDRADVPDLLRAVDIFAQPSRFEGQSNALLEALHEGLAILASRIPPQVETLSQDSAEPAGRLIGLDEPAAWTAALRDLAQDPTQRAALGARARARAAAFSAGSMAEGFERLLLAAVSSGTRSRLV